MLIPTNISQFRILYLFIAFGIISCNSQRNNFPVLKGPYLGQEPPGMVPEIFAPGIISTPVHEGCVSFNSNNSLFLFTRSGVGILSMRLINGTWSVPELASFSSGTSDWDFMLAPDDKTVFVSSGRPDTINGKRLENYRIWSSELINDKWSDPVLLPSPVNTGQHDSYPSPANDGTLYFFSNRKEGLGEGDIYRAIMYNGEYVAENLNRPVNTVFHEVDAFIDPDQDYIIFCSDKPGGLGDSDLYISFIEEAGKWSDPINLGEDINTEAAEYVPYVTPDGKYLFYTSDISGNYEIYWVDTRFIRELWKQEDF